MYRVRVAAIAWLLILVPYARGTSLSIDALCHIDLPGGVSTISTLSTRTNEPATGGCSIGTAPEFFLDYLHWDNFAEARGGVEYGVESGEFTLGGFTSVRAYLPFIDTDIFIERLDQVSYSMSLDLVASSSGPSRPGLIELMALSLGSSDPGGSLIVVSLQVGSLAAASDSIIHLAGTFPFVLGEPFHINVATEGVAGTDGVFGPGDRLAEFQLNFHLTELDGEPVDVELVSVPEPSAFLLLASGASLLLALSRLRRSV
jgi:hypothetical protein